MAGAMRKMAVYLGLVEDDQYDDEYLDDVDRTPDNRAVEDDERSGRRDADRPGGRDGRVGRSGGRTRADLGTADTLRVSEERESRVEPTARPSRNWRVETIAQEPVGAHPAGSRSRTRATASTGADLKIATLHPRSYNDARRIGEDYRSGTPVIMNLTDLEDTDAKRIVDFAAGLVFGMRGSIERVATKVFLLSPANVDVAEEARAQLAKDGLVGRR